MGAPLVRLAQHAAQRQVDEIEMRQPAFDILRCECREEPVGPVVHHGSCHVMRR